MPISTTTDPASYIRLLEVSEHDEGSHSKRLECHLTTWRAHEAPPYQAISYTWANGSSAEVITLKGDATGRMKVRKNLADVLRQLLYSKSSSYYWIDALSINQAGLDEKGHQVAMMGSTFNNAKHVLACLGEYDDDAEYAMQAISEIAEFRFGSAATAPSPGPGAFSVHTAWDHENGIANDLALPGWNWFRYATPLVALTRRPYFSRVWVVQELLLARNVSICCGNFRVSLNIFENEVLEAYEDELLMKRYMRNRLANDNEELNESNDPKSQVSNLLEDEFKEAIQLPECTFGTNCINLLNMQLKSQPVFDCNGTLRLLNGLQCHDSRDKVYGGLALIDSNLHTRMKPDYTLSGFQLVPQMLKHGLDPSLVTTLMRTLKITAEDHDLHVAISARRHTGDHMLGGSRRNNRAPRNDMITFEVAGRQLPEVDASWSYDTATIHIKSFWHVPSYAQIDVWVPQDTVAGNWILDRCLAFREQGEEYGNSLVLRQVGEQFAIIGRARYRAIPSTTDRYPVNAHRQFVVTLDAEDLLVCIALETLPCTTPGREVSFCRKRFSSFATLKLKQTGPVKRKLQTPSSKTSIKRRKTTRRR